MYNFESKMLPDHEWLAGEEMHDDIVAYLCFQIDSILAILGEEMWTLIQISNDICNICHNHVFRLTAILATRGEEVWTSL